MLGYGYGFTPSPVLTSEQTRTMANAQAQNVAAGLVEPPRVLNAPSPAPTVSIPSIHAPDRARIALAAARAKKLFAGPIGDCLASELGTWVELGYRIDAHGNAARLVNAVMDWPAPDEPEAAAA